MPLKFGSEAEYHAWRASHPHLAGSTPPPTRAKVPTLKSPKITASASVKPRRSRKRRSAAAGLSLARVLGALGVHPPGGRGRRKGRRKSHRIGWL